MQLSILIESKFRLNALTMKLVRHRIIIIVIEIDAPFRIVIRLDIRIVPLQAIIDDANGDITPRHAVLPHAGHIQVDIVV